MHNISPNLISVIAGISMILICFLIFWLFQSKLFSQYHNQVNPIIKKEHPDQLE